MRPRFLIALSALTAMCLAGPTRGEDLLQIYREAISQDPVLSAARASWLATQERLPQARASLLPQVGLSGSATATAAAIDIRSSPSTNAKNEFGALGLAVSASQPLYRRQNVIAVDQARQQLDQSDLVLLSAQQDLIVRVAQAYFDVLLALDSIAFVAAQKAAVSEQLAQARRNFEVGTATITDTNEAQARFDQIVAQEIAAQADYDNKRAALRSIIGRPPGELKPLGPQYQVRLPEPNVLEHWTERAAVGNYQVRVAQSSFDIASLEVERSRAGREPTVDLVGSLSGSYATGSTVLYADQANRQAVIGVQLAMPLYTGGFIDSRVREAIALQDRARQDLENARRAAVFQAQQAYLGVTAGAAAVRAFEQALVSAETAVASNKLGQEVGVRTNLDVLNVESSLFQVRRDLAQVRYVFLVSALRLWAAVGDLDDAKLERVNSVLGY